MSEDEKTPEMTEEVRRNYEEMRRFLGDEIERRWAADTPERAWIKYMAGVAVGTGYSMAKLAMEKYGDEAKELLAQALHDAGYEHGKRARARVEARGGDIDDMRELHAEYRQDYAEHYDLYQVEVLKNRWAMRLPVCHMATALKEWHAKVPECKDPHYWCDYDFGFIEAYNPKVKLSRPHWLVAGDPYCEYIWELPEE